MSIDESNDLLPLGSLVRTGGEKLLMVVARALRLTLDAEPYYVDYGACCFPEGMIGDTMLFFNTEDIIEVVHEGFRNDQDAEWLQLIDEAGQVMAVPKSDTRVLREVALAAELAGEADRG